MRGGGERGQGGGRTGREGEKHVLLTQHAHIHKHTQKMFPFLDIYIHIDDTWCINISLSPSLRLLSLPPSLRLLSLPPSLRLLSLFISLSLS